MKHILDLGSVFLSPSVAPHVPGLVHNALHEVVAEEGLKVRTEGDEKSYRLKVYVELEEEA